MRIPNDVYYTPDDVAERCVGQLPVRLCPRILEPSCGGGAFLRALRKQYPPCGGCGEIGAIDVNENAEHGPADWFMPMDFLDFKPAAPFDLIVGNPPYKDAEAHVHHALSLLSEEGVLGFLLRLSFLGGQRRRASLWKDYPPANVCILSKRPSFTGGGTDSSDYAFFVWAPDSYAHGFDGSWI